MIAMLSAEVVMVLASTPPGVIAAIALSSGVIASVAYPPVVVVVTLPRVEVVTFALSSGVIATTYRMCLPQLV